MNSAQEGVVVALSRRRLLAALAAQSLLIACGRSSRRAMESVTTTSSPLANTVTIVTTTSSTSIPTTTTTVPPVALTVMNDSGVTAEEIELITRILKLANSELGATGSLQVYVYSDLEELLRSGAFIPAAVEHRRMIYSQGNVAEAGAGKVIIYMPNFRRNQDKEKIVIHEYYHELQSHHLGSRLIQPDAGVPSAGPSWLIEGSAEYFGYKVASASGLASYSSVRQRGVRSSRQLSPLSEYENLRKFNAAGPEGIWAFGVLTTEFMVTRYGEGNVRAEYWKAVKGASGWQQAFANAFGEPVEDFYRVYEEYRTTLR